MSDIVSHNLEDKDGVYSLSLTINHSNRLFYLTTKKRKTITSFYEMLQRVKDKFLRNEDILLDEIEAEEEDIVKRMINERTESENDPPNINKDTFVNDEETIQIDYEENESRKEIPEKSGLSTTVKIFIVLGVLCVIVLCWRLIADNSGPAKTGEYETNKLVDNAYLECIDSSNDSLTQAEFTIKLDEVESIIENHFGFSEADSVIGWKDEGSDGSFQTYEFLSNDRKYDFLIQTIPSTNRVVNVSLLVDYDEFNAETNNLIDGIYKVLGEQVNKKALTNNFKKILDETERAYANGLNMVVDTSRSQNGKYKKKGLFIMAASESAVEQLKEANDYTYIQDVEDMYKE